jgi:hypothetical protein
MQTKQIIHGVFTNSLCPFFYRGSAAGPLYLDKFYVLFMNFLPALYEFSNVMED